MNNSEITIFYSWQSDLPANTTRSIIQDSIKDAVTLLRNTVHIEADRDTQGQFGSPEISQTIFSKIDSCDIFIADVTPVCQYQKADRDGNPIGNTKLMPNPNVMLELGYATRAVGWDNVICIINTDYGNVDQMPFDIRNRRLTTYSLSDGKSKSEVKRHIKGIIQETVENILDNGKRPKSGFSYLKVVFFMDGKIMSQFKPPAVSQSVSFINRKNMLIAKCTELLKEIRSLLIVDDDLDLQENCVHDLLTAEPIVTEDGEVFKPVKPSSLFETHKVCVKDEDRENIKILCKKYLGEEISEDSDIFNIGNLKVCPTFGFFQGNEYVGTDVEKAKYDKLISLQHSLNQLMLLDWYVITFDGLMYVPLSIENTSSIYDEDIDIRIEIDPEKVTAILPSKELINSEMKGLEGFIVEDKIIKDLFIMLESAEISYDDADSFLYDSSPSISINPINAAGINGNPQYDEDDYEAELCEYIAAPITDNPSQYKFSISSLRAKEKKWLRPALLLKPLSENFEIKYTIKSKNSDGTLDGIIQVTQ